MDIMLKKIHKQNNHWRRILSLSLLLLSFHIYAGKTENKEVKIGDSFWVYASSHAGIVGVTWTWDTDCFDLISNIYATSGQAQFRAVKATPKTGATIQAVTRYQMNNAPGSYTDYDDWKVVVIDDAEISLPNNLSLGIGEKYLISAQFSVSNYGGNVSWHSSSPSTVGISAKGANATLTGLSTGNAIVTAKLDNGASASCNISVVEQNISSELSEYEIVDLGLSVNWASKNVGATTEYADGDLFAWGETYSKYNFTIQNSKTYNIDVFINSDFIYDNGLYNLPIYLDAANANMGENWRIPTSKEFDELLKLDRIALKDSYGRECAYKIIGENGNFIIIPLGEYWSSSTGSNIQEALCFTFSQTHDFLGNNVWRWSNDRYHGCNIRGVTQQKSTKVDNINTEDRQVKGGNGVIFTRNCYNIPFTIYTLSGDIVMQGICDEVLYINSPGLYIMKIADKCYKIIVS